MQVLFIVSLLLIAFQASSAPFQRPSSLRPRDNCGYVDLRPLFGPVRSQGDIGWCYANATADFLSYKFRDEMHGEPVSSSHVALTNNRILFSRANSEGGFASIAILLSQFEGLCPQNVEDSVRAVGVEDSLKTRITGLVHLKQNFDRTGGASLEADLMRYFIQTKSVLNQMPIEDLRTLLKTSTERNFVSNFAEYFCRGKKVIPRHKHPAVGMTKYLLGGWTGPLMDKIHLELDRKEPIIIDYFADMFDVDNAKKGGRHTSVVVGRQWNEVKGQCELLIRNSWGTGCHQYKAESLKDSCEAGNVWVSQEYLNKYIYGVVYYPNLGYVHEIINRFSVH